MALAQETETLILDEPTTFLDMAHGLEVLQLLDRLNREEGRTVLMVLHDLNSAARFAHHMIALAGGRMVAAGRPREILTPHLLGEVFSIEADVVPDPRAGAPLCIPYGFRCTPHDQSPAEAEIKPWLRAPATRSEPHECDRREVKRLFARKPGYGHRGVTA